MSRARRCTSSTHKTRLASSLMLWSSHSGGKAAFVFGSMLSFPAQNTSLNLATALVQTCIPMMVPLLEQNDIAPLPTRSRTSMESWPIITAWLGSCFLEACSPLTETFIPRRLILRFLNSTAIASAASYATKMSSMGTILSPCLALHPCGNFDLL